MVGQRNACVSSKSFAVSRRGSAQERNFQKWRRMETWENESFGRAVVSRARFGERVLILPVGDQTLQYKSESETDTHCAALARNCTPRTAGSLPFSRGCKQEFLRCMIVVSVSAVFLFWLFCGLPAPNTPATKTLHKLENGSWRGLSGLVSDAIRTVEDSSVPGPTCVCVWRATQA